MDRASVQDVFDESMQDIWKYADRKLNQSQTAARLAYIQTEEDVNAAVSALIHNAVKQVLGT